MPVTGHSLPAGDWKRPDLRGMAFLTLTLIGITRTVVGVSDVRAIRASPRWHGGPAYGLSTTEQVHTVDLTSANPVRVVPTVEAVLAGFWMAAFAHQSGWIPLGKNRFQFPVAWKAGQRCVVSRWATDNRELRGDRAMPGFRHGAHGRDPRDKTSSHLEYHYLGAAIRASGFPIRVGRCPTPPSMRRCGSR